ncbi:hypothetical protein B0H16DRAFT_115478 [Mycena metata]|uniref:WSC domain-containing protein n=1 Tax=Mycena metata TaxID=1033252 RepID=A0AAD7K1U2_9AGAR|nr:hypothetical protein B0H16DRAFT_115478 [Mycena metata]
MTPLYLNALFSLLVARVAFSAAPHVQRQVYTTTTNTSVYTTTNTSNYTAPTGPCNGSSTETDTVTYTETTTVTDTETASVPYTEATTVTDTETASVTETATDSVTTTETTTATETDSVIVTESITTTITATSTAPAQTTSACATPTPVTSWTYLGCYTDAIGARTLSAVQMPDSTHNSVASCQAACFKAGYAYAGLEDAVQCFCDSAIKSGVGLGGTCNSACSGGVGTCGGIDAIDIYEAVTAPCATPWTFRGCYPDTIATRTLTTVQLYDIARNSVATCQTSCLNAGFAYAGVEDANQCFCASSIRAGVSPESLTNCQSACSGGVGACGGVDAIAIYQAT